MIEILPLWSLQNLIYFSTKDSAQSSLHSQYFIDKRKWCIKMVRNIALGSDQSNIEQEKMIFINSIIFVDFRCYF